MRRLVIIFLIISILEVFIGVSAADQEETQPVTGYEEMRGNIIFSPAGRIAAPVYYRHYGVRLCLQNFSGWILGVKGQVKSLFNHTVNSMRLQLKNKQFGVDTIVGELRATIAADMEEMFLLAQRVTRFQEAFTHEKRQYERKIFGSTGTEDIGQQVKDIEERTKRGEWTHTGATNSSVGINGTQVRETRQVVAGAVAAVAGLISVGSVLFSQGEVHQLEERIEGSSHRLKMDETIIAEIGSALKNWELRDYKSHLMGEAKENLVKWIRRAKKEMKRILKGLEALQRHYIRTDFMGEIDLAEVKKAVYQDERRTGARALMDEGRGIMDVPFSTVIRQESAMVIFHVPFVLDGSRMVRQLHYLEGALVQGSRGLMRLTAPEPYISVSDHEEVHVAHRTGDLLQCHRTNRLYLCERGEILLKEIDSCVAALYYQNQGQIRKRCHLNIIGEEVEELRTGEKTFRVQPLEQFHEVCEDKVSRRVFADGQGDVLIGEGCTLSGPRSLLVNNPRSGTRTVSVREVEVNIPRTAMKMPGDDLDWDFDRLTEVINGAQAWQDTSDTLRAHTTGLWVTAGGIAMICVSLSILVGWTVHRLNREATRSKGTDLGETCWKHEEEANQQMIKRALFSLRSATDETRNVPQVSPTSSGDLHRVGRVDYITTSDGGQAV